MTATTDRKLSTARLLGIGGGVIGIIVWLIVAMTLLVGGVAFRVPGDDLARISGALLLGLLVNLLGIRGGKLARRNAGRAALYLALAGLGSWIVFKGLWIVFGPLFLIGALLAWVGRSSDEPARQEANT